MGMPTVTVLPDPTKMSFLQRSSTKIINVLKPDLVNPLTRASKSLFGLKQDPRFAEPGIAQDRAAAAATALDPAGGFKTQAQIRARRPVRGIQIKEDTYCSLRIIGDDNHPIFQVDASGEDDPADKTRGRSFLNTNFIAQSIQEERVEKSQILETFGAPFVFFFGERPRFVNVSGFLLNTVDFNWRAEWWENYENKLRGTKLVEQRAKAFLTWDDIVVAGYVLNAAAQDISTEPYRIPFQFTIYMTNYFNIGIRGKIPVGFTSPIDRLRSDALGVAGTGPEGIFQRLLPPGSEVSNAIARVSRAANPVRTALSIVQGIAAHPSKLLDAPRDIEALTLLQGGIAPLRKYGPLRTNYDEFLNTQLDALDIGTPRFSGFSKNQFMQRLLNFVPGLNSALETTKILGSLSKNKMGMQGFRLNDATRGLLPFGTLFPPGTSSFIPRP